MLVEFPASSGCKGVGVSLVDFVVVFSRVFQRLKLACLSHNEFGWVANHDEDL